MSWNVVWSLWAATTQDAQVPPAAPTDTTVLDYLASSGIVGLVLLVLSVCAVALILMQWYGLRQSRLAPAPVVEVLSRMVKDGDWDAALQSARAPENDCYISRVLASAISRCGKSSLGMFELRKAMEEAAQRETEKLYRQTDLIGLIAAVGPMLGLLGTVFGMIGAFGSISDLEGAARSRELASFMAMALVNTAQGLAVAIPCTAAFSLFRRRIERIVSEIAETGEEMIAFAPVAGRSGTSFKPASKSFTTPANIARP